MKSFLVVVAVLSFTASLPAEPIATLKPTGRVNDFAYAFDDSSRAKLDTACREIDEKANAQVVIVTVNSLDGVNIYDYSVDLFKQWHWNQAREPRCADPASSSGSSVPDYRWLGSRLDSQGRKRRGFRPRGSALFKARRLLFSRFADDVQGSARYRRGCRRHADCFWVSVRSTRLNRSSGLPHRRAGTARSERQQQYGNDLCSRLPGGCDTSLSSDPTGKEKTCVSRRAN